MKAEIKDVNLAGKGKDRIDWAGRRMPVVNLIRERFRKEKPLKGMRVAACLHVTTETANLVKALKAGGAEVSLCASNPLSTQDDAAASLVKHDGISVFAYCGEDRKSYYRHINSALQNPHVTLDDGADLVSTIHSTRKDLVKDILGGTEETTTGVIRLRSLERKGLLLYPLIAVNDARTKHLFDNRYGTGQSTIDGIVRATNILLAGSTFVVAGYGWCGRGVAMRARGMGANVIVTEVDPLRALEAVMDGFRVMPMSKAARKGDVFVTLTGDVKAISKNHFQLMKDGAIVANAGHFNVEIDLAVLKKMSKKKKRVREFIDEYTLNDGRRINVLAEGRLINLAVAEGHPPAVMDMSFANQALCVEHIARKGKGLGKKVYSVPKEIDEKVAKLKLKVMGEKIDRLSSEQKKYLTSWELGT